MNQQLNITARALRRAMAAGMPADARALLLREAGEPAEVYAAPEREYRASDVYPLLRQLDRVLAAQVAVLYPGTWED